MAKTQHIIDVAMQAVTTKEAAAPMSALGAIGISFTDVETTLKLLALALSCLWLVVQIYCKLREGRKGND